MRDASCGLMIDQLRGRVDDPKGLLDKAKRRRK